MVPQMISIQNNQRILIQASWLFDGQTSVLQKNASLFIVNNILHSHTTIPSSIPYLTPTQVFHFPHCTILPGLVDCHVHLALDGLDFQHTLKRWNSPTKNWLQEEQHILEALQHGIMVLRDGGDKNGIALAISRQRKREHKTTPFLCSSGPALRKEHFYGSFLGPACDPQKLSKIIQERRHTGATHIKVLVSGIASFQEYGKVGSIQFTQQELNHLVQIATSYGLPVMAHASSDQAVQMAIKAGVRSIEHGYFMTKATLKEMATKGIVWVPTLAAVANQLQEGYAQQYTEKERKNIAKMVQSQLEMVALAGEFNVSLAIGTDAGANGVFHGKDYLTELLLMQKAGLSTSKILSAAISGGAGLLGLNHHGTFGVGQPVSCIIVQGNPLQDMRCLSQIHSIFYPA